MLVHFILALLPILWLILALGKLKMPSYTACGIALLLTAALAGLYWKLPVLHVASAALEGILNALWPICLVIIAALFTYNLSVATGAMERIKTMLGTISNDQRILLLIIGWGFGNFMEGMAGFGTAVAIPASMLAGIGLDPLSAVLACLVMNTTPTAFGSVGVPTATLASITGLELLPLASNAAFIQVFHTFISPFLAVMICGGGIKALKGVLGTTLIASLSFIIPSLLFARFLGPELPNIVGSMCAMLCIIIAVKIRNAFFTKSAAQPVQTETETVHISFAEGLQAWAPFILIFVLLLSTSPLFPPLYNAIKDIKTSVMVYTGTGGKPLTFSWINTPGIMIFIAAVCGSLIQKARLSDTMRVFIATLKKYWTAVFTICAVIATAKIMIYSGMISDIAIAAVAGAGPVYPFVAPLIGVLGAFITGSGTSTCVLFGNLQLETATALQLNPYWITAANVMGAGIGKMVCPQNIAIGAGATNLTGSESKILASVFKYFILYALLAGLICWLGSLVMVAAL